MTNDGNLAGGLEGKTMVLSMKRSGVMPIRMSGNGRYFLDRAGEPLFCLGDTLWLLFRAHTAAEVEALLRDRKAKGFNALLIMLIGFEESFAANVNGDLPFEDSDPARLNERYFAHVDAMLRIASELDFILVCGVYHKTHAKFYTLEKVRESARRIADRYKEVPQVIWSMYPEAKSGSIAMCRAIAEGLREGDGGAHMITVHPDPSPQSSSFLHHEPWLAFNMLQTWCDFELVYPMTAADYAMTPVKPVVMAEGGYEGTLYHGEFISPADIRRQAYWTYLAGGHLVYGHHKMHREMARWREWMNAPGSRYVSVFRKIAEALPAWWNVVPDQSIIMDGARSGMELNAAARSEAGDWAMVYFSSPCAALVRMDRIKSSEKVAGSWIDPKSGEKTRIGEYRFADIREFAVPEGWEDAVLLLEGA
jgi:hypothetical protein